MQIVDAALPKDLQEAIKAIKPSQWIKRACSRYRRNSSINMGLGTQRNICKQRKFVYGRCYKILPELLGNRVFLTNTNIPHEVSECGDQVFDRYLYSFG